MRAFKIILVAMAFITLQVHAKDDGRNLVVKQNTSASKRVALVIGNGDYQNSDSLPKLANPTHDAEDIAAVLRGFGFEVIEKKDQSLEGMSDAITEFSRKIGDSEAALFYFAGHGLQVKGQNYIIPVDAKIETEAQVPFKSINVNLILEEMDNGKSRANIVMLDACRNNPISGKFRSGATRGLAAPTSQPKGTVIVYATDPGNVAADGSGRNGLFTAGLLTAFKGSDLSLGGVLVRASEEVERGSAQKQTPYINGPATLQKNFQFAPGQATQIASLMPIPAQAAVHVKSSEEIEQETWNSARDSANIGAIQEYLKQYPNGRFIGQANVLIATLKPAPVKLAEPITPTVRVDNETALWTEAQKGGTAEDYRAYLGQYPKGKYAALAKGRLKKLDDEAAQQAKQEREAAAQQAAQQEQSAWDSANGSASEASYQGYLNSYPQGRYATLATARIAKLKKETVQAAANGPKPGQTFRDCPGCPEMVVIPAGSFDMGSPSYEAGRFDNEGPVHRINVSAFALGKTEITRGQFAAFVNETSYSTGDKCWVWVEKWEERSGQNWRNPGYRQEDDHPVVCINWNNAKAYTEWLSRKTGKQYRLPSEAEWEYAARGNTSTTRYWGDSPDQACGYENDADKTAQAQMSGITSWAVHNCTDGYVYTAPVARFKPNAFGLHDMLGNVAEWVEDSYHGNYNGAPTDGSVWLGDGAKRLLRGLGWSSELSDARTAKRLASVPVNYYSESGFRLARALP